jgi:hypothetical protein
LQSANGKYQQYLISKRTSFSLSICWVPHKGVSLPTKCSKSANLCAFTDIQLIGEIKSPPTSDAKRTNCRTCETAEGRQWVDSDVSKNNNDDLPTRLAVGPVDPLRVCLTPCLRPVQFSFHTTSAPGYSAREECRSQPLARLKHPSG